MPKQTGFGRAVFICMGLAVGLAAGSAGAMTPPLRTSFIHTPAIKKNAYRTEGVFTGGEAGTGTSLLAVRRSFSKRAGLERVILDLGDKEAKPAGKLMGYFQAGVDARNNRVTVDVSQLRLSKVTEAQVRHVFKDSAFVRNVALTFDPEDHAATMVLDLKKPMKVEVYRTIKAGQPARIVLDLLPRTIR